MTRAWGVAILAWAGCSSNPVLPDDETLDLRLSIETPVVREGGRLEAELVVTNLGKLPTWLPGAVCPSQLWVRDERGNATGQVVACAAAIPGEDHRIDPGETRRFPRSWRSLGAWPGRYFAVGYVTIPRGPILFSDTVAIWVEPASP